jgi:myosin-5
MGASIDTYLLEKARIVGHTCGERTYHVFYEVLAKGSLAAAERKKFFIDNKSASDFSITTSDGGKDKSKLLHKGYDDHAKMFKELTTAMNTMGFGRQEQMEIFQAVCGLLHLSNMTLQNAFVEKNDGEECMLNQNSPSLKPALSLLGVSYEALNAAVTTVQFKAVGELVKKNLNASQAIRAVQALIKGAYDSIFALLVDRINKCIVGSSMDNEVIEDGAFIGLLDIFGFESFELNSFEQLCINYCNESLQQQFNRFVFKLEQQEYKREGIKWDMIEFEDNQDILDLIERKHGGILTILDEQCKLGMRCNDKTFVSAVYNKCMSTSDRFDANKKQKSQGKFSIYHYAGIVEYDTTGFMEKNKDEIPMEASELFSNSSCAFIQNVAHVISTKMNGSGSQNESKRQAVKSSISRVSVGGQFSSQLQKLRRRIDETHPHYVRCLKPNDQLQPGHFDLNIVVDQLRCGGILEAIRVSRAGFPHRYTFDHFESRFGILSSAVSSSATKQRHPRRVGKLILGNHGGTPAKRKVVTPKKQRTDPKKSCEVLVKVIAQWMLAEREQNKEADDSVEADAPMAPGSVSPRSFWKSQTPQKSSQRGNTSIHSQMDTSEAGIQLGATKVFLLQDTFDCIERFRGQVIAANATKITSCVRMYIARKAYLVMLRSYRESINPAQSPLVEAESRDDNSIRQVDFNLEMFESSSCNQDSLA